MCNRNYCVLLSLTDSSELSCELHKQSYMTSPTAGNYFKQKEVNRNLVSGDFILFQIYK